MRNTVHVLKAITVAASLLAAPAAYAGTFPAAEISYDMAVLSQFNLVTLGNYTNASGTNQTVAGRTIVGGNANLPGGSVGTGFCYAASCAGNATSAIDPSTKMYGALTVFGNVTGNFGGMNAGTAYIGGNASGYLLGGGKSSINVVGSGSGLTVDSAVKLTTAAANFQGTRTGSTPAAVTSTTNPGLSAATVFPFGSSALTAELKNLSKGIAALPGSPGVSAKALPKGDNIFFTATNDYIADGKKYGVVTISLADLSSETNFKGINNNGNDATFVIVTGDVMTSGKTGYNANYVLPNLNSYAGADKVIFDFVDATTLKFAGNWNGTILAPLANITQQGGTLDGSIIVNSINQTQALYASNLFTGSLTGLVPEPASLLLFGLGAAAAGFVRRRRKTA